MWVSGAGGERGGGWHWGNRATPRRSVVAQWRQRKVQAKGILTAAAAAEEELGDGTIGAGGAGVLGDVFEQHPGGLDNRDDQRRKDGGA